MNVFDRTNPKIQQKLVAMLDATDLRLVGNISPMIAHGNGPKPAENDYISIHELYGVEFT